jgi:Lon protease-like protein
MPLSLHIFEPRYRQLIADLLHAGGTEQARFGVVALRRGWEVGAAGALYDVGTCARVVRLRPHADGRYDLAAVGAERFAIQSLDSTSRPYLVGRVTYLEEPEQEPGAEPDDTAPGESTPTTAARVAAARVRAVRASFNDYLAALADLTDVQDEPRLSDSGEGRATSYAVARLSSLTTADRQALLSCRSTAARLDLARRILRRETVLLTRLRAIPAGVSHFRIQRTLS